MENTQHESEKIAHDLKKRKPDWMIAWRQSETFERDARILTMIGETSLSRRPLIDLQAAELLGIKKASGSIGCLPASRGKMFVACELQVHVWKVDHQLIPLEL